MTCLLYLLAFISLLFYCARADTIFDEQVWNLVLRHPDAPTYRLWKTLEEEQGRSVALSGLYASLDRLERAGRVVGRRSKESGREQLYWRACV